MLQESRRRPKANPKDYNKTTIILSWIELMKKRYLLSFSYVGTHFKSCAKTTKDVDLSTVVGTLETALYSLPAESTGITEVSPVIISSRTDAGVHALQNSAHVDISGNTLATNELMFSINKFLQKQRVPLRVLGIRQVSNEFNARKFASQRTYLYRIAAPKLIRSNNAFLIPISEWQRCYFLRAPLSKLDILQLQEVLCLFPGVRDFTSFCGRPTHQEGRTLIRYLHSFDICPGEPFMNPLFEPLSDEFDFWDIIAEGSSFIYRQYAEKPCKVDNLHKVDFIQPQVRRMVSAALAVTEGKLTFQDVRHMLDSPSPQATLNYTLVPSYGLYLTRVYYEDSILSPNWERVKKVKSSKPCEKD